MYWYWRVKLVHGYQQILLVGWYRAILFTKRAPLTASAVLYISRISYCLFSISRWFGKWTRNNEVKTIAEKEIGISNFYESFCKIFSKSIIASVINFYHSHILIVHTTKQIKNDTKCYNILLQCEILSKVSPFVKVNYGTLSCIPSFKNYYNWKIIFLVPFPVLIVPFCYLYNMTHMRLCLCFNV